MNNIIRIPRPLGITELSLRYNHTLDNEDYLKLKQILIHSYLRNNFSYCGHYMNIEQFSFVSRISIDDIKKEVVVYGKEMGNLSKELVNGDMARALFQNAFFGILEDRSRIAQQLDIMTAAQQNTYKPFISGEVNRTLKMMMEATGNTMNFMKMFMGPGQGTGNPNPLFASDQNNENENDSLTVDKFVRELKANGITPLEADNTQLLRLAEVYDVENQPEVNALLQTGADTSREGLTMGDLTKISDEVLSRTEKHVDRRAKEIGIDLDSDEI